MDEIRYGKLVVDSSKGVIYKRSGVRSGGRKALNKRKYVYVVCDCGNEKWMRVDAFKIKRKIPQSCNSCHTGKNWIGKTFNYWTVLDILPKYNNSIVKWRCQCTCGKTKDVRSSDIIDGNSKSCGCISYRAIDLIGEQFGHLQVIDKGPQGTWLCKCICKHEMFIKGARLKHGVVRSCGCVSWKSLKHKKGYKHDYETKADDYNDEEVEFLNAIELYKRANNVKWLSSTHYFEILVRLGYRKEIISPKLYQKQKQKLKTE